MHTTALGIPADDRRRLDFVLYGTTMQAKRGAVLRCHARVTLARGRRCPCAAALPVRCPRWRMAPRHSSRRWQHTNATRNAPRLAPTLAPPPSLGSCSVWWRLRTWLLCPRRRARRSPRCQRPQRPAGPTSSPRARVGVDRSREGRVVPQQWLVHTTAPGIPADDRHRLDFVLYGATMRGEVLCCDVTLVSPLRADGRPQPGSCDRDGAAIEVARRANSRGTPSSPGPDRSGWWCL